LNLQPIRGEKVMGMARRPVEPGVDRRQQMIEAALDVFAEQGFEGATTKDIAARADVTQGLIYFYFRSKEDLFLAAYEHQAQRAFARLRFPDPERSDEPPAAVIRRVVGELVDTLDVPRSLSLMRITMRALAHCDEGGDCGKPVEEARRRIREEVRGLGQSLRAYLDGQVARGALRPHDTALASHLLLGALMIAITRRASGDDDLTRLSRERLVDGVVDLFLGGLLPRPDGPPAPEPAAAASTA
jgi:AcrR family transcriptional regulator